MDILVSFFLGHLVLSSAFHGQVRLNNQPLVGATIIREVKWAWNSEAITEKTQTDLNGVFKFNEIIKKSFSAKWLPHEPNISLTYRLEYNGKSYLIFPYDKGNYDQYGEFPQKKPHQLICELVPKENSQRLDVRCQLEKS